MAGLGIAGTTAVIDADTSHLAAGLKVAATSVNTFANLTEAEFKRLEDVTGQSAKKIKATIESLDFSAAAKRWHVDASNVPYILQKEYEAETLRNADAIERRKAFASGGRYKPWSGPSGGGRLYAEQAARSAGLTGESTQAMNSAEESASSLASTMVVLGKGVLTAATAWTAYVLATNKSLENTEKQAAALGLTVSGFKDLTRQASLLSVSKKELGGQVETINRVVLAAAASQEKAAQFQSLFNKRVEDFARLDAGARWNEFYRAVGGADSKKAIDTFVDFGLSQKQVAEIMRISQKDIMGAAVATSGLAEASAGAKDEVSRLAEGFHQTRIEGTAFLKAISIEVIAKISIAWQRFMDGLRRGFAEFLDDLRGMVAAIRRFTAIIPGAETAWTKLDDVIAASAAKISQIAHREGAALADMFRITTGAAQETGKAVDTLATRVSKAMEAADMSGPYHAWRNEVDKVSEAFELLAERIKIVGDESGRTISAISGAAGTQVNGVPQQVDFRSREINDQIARQNEAARKARMAAATGPSQFEQFGEALSTNLARTIASGNFKNVGDALVGALQASLAQSAAKQLTKIFSQLFKSVFSSFGGGGGSGLLGGLIGGITKFFSFHEGGIVPGGPRQERLALVRGQEAIFTPSQVRALQKGMQSGGGGMKGGDTIINITGNVDAATEEAIGRLMPKITRGVNAEGRRQYIGGG